MFCSCVKNKTFFVFVLPTIIYFLVNFLRGLVVCLYFNFDINLIKVELDSFKNYLNSHWLSAFLFGFMIFFDLMLAFFIHRVFYYCLVEHQQDCYVLKYLKGGKDFD